MYALITLLLICTLSISATAKSNSPTVSIDKFNLVFADNVYLKYAVRFDGVDDDKISSDNIGMLYFSAPQAEYVAGNEVHSSNVVGHTTIDGKKYYTFEYRHITAKQMTDYIYSVAYLDVDGARYYSAPVKYSVLDYCYSRLGKTGVASENDSFKKLLTATLEQGAAAQEYFGYNVDRLANDEYYLVEVVGGVLEDGFAKSLYHSGEKATLTALDDGSLICASWQTSIGNSYSINEPLVITEFISNETYSVVNYSSHTEVIDEAKKPSCTETGLTSGIHCAVCDTVILAQEIIPKAHDFINQVCTICGEHLEARGFMHISFDDVSYSFANLSTKNYTSLYDEPFFAWLKSLHELYGAKFSLYVYDGALNNVPDTYASEFRSASDWLKIGLHDGGNGVYNSFAGTSYSAAQSYWNNFVAQVKRFTGGTDNIDRVPRLHYFAASKEALIGMSEAECGALGFISADDDRISYYFNSEIRDYLYDNDHITDLSNGLVFLSTDMRGDWFNSGFSSANNYKAPSYDNVYDELIHRFSSDEYSVARESFIFFAHEWQFYNGSVLNSNTIWTEDACRFAKEKGIAFDYAQNRTFSSTPYDITSAEGPVETEAVFDGVTLNIVDDFGSVNYVGGYTINGSGLKYTALAPRAVSKTEILRVSDDARVLSLDLTKLSIKDKLYYTVYLFSDLPLNSSTYQDLGGKSGTWMQEDIIIPSDAKYIMILFKNGNDEAFSSEDLALLNQCVIFSESIKQTSVKYYNTELQVVDSIEQMVFDPEYTMPGNAGADFSKTTLNGRACCVTSALAVEGGETLALVDNLEELFGSSDLFWSLIEFKDAPLSPNLMSTTSSAATGRAWINGSHKLNANTKYVIIAFKNGDGSIDFTEEQLAVLSRCLVIK